MTKTNKLEVVQQIYAAINRNDIPAVLNFFDPQIERVEFEGTPSGGTFRGLPEVEAHFLKSRATWAEGSCEPTQIIAEGNKVIVLVHVRVRLKDQTEWLEGNVADVFVFKNGKVIEMRSFFKAQEAFEWAGVKP